MAKRKRNAETKARDRRMVSYYKDSAARNISIIEKRVAAVVATDNLRRVQS